MGRLDYHLQEFTVDSQKCWLPTDEDRGTEPRIQAAKARLIEMLKLRETSINHLYELRRCLGTRADTDKYPSGSAGCRLPALRRQ